MEIMKSPEEAKGVIPRLVPLCESTSVVGRGERGGGEVRVLTIHKTMPSTRGELSE